MRAQFASDEITKQFITQKSIYGIPAKKKYLPCKEAGGPEWRETLDDMIVNDELDPELAEYSIPDFGFQDKFNSRETSMGIWDVLFDNIR